MNWCDPQTMILPGNLSSFSKILAGIPYQTFGELSSPYQVLQRLIQLNKVLSNTKMNTCLSFSVCYEKIKCY